MHSIERGMNMAKCIGFQMKSVEEAIEHMDYEIVRDYGDYAYGNYLYTWDDGNRLLARCKKCGGYILIQHSEFHSAIGDDSYYTDYFPVDSEREAEELNKQYGGFAIEEEFPGKYIIYDDGGIRVGWKRGNR